MKNRFAHIGVIFAFAWFAGACSSTGDWGAGGTPRPDGTWRADMTAMLAEPVIMAELDRGDDRAKKQFLDYLRGVRLDINGSRLRGGSIDKPGKWVRFRVVKTGRAYMVIRYRLKREFSPAVVRLDFPGVNRLRFKELNNKQSPPLFFKR